MLTTSARSQDTTAPAPAASEPAPSAATTAPPRPTDSVYWVEGDWTTQTGETLTLDDFAGGPVVALLFFGSCRHACPALMADLERLDAALPADARGETRYMLVTIDPERDTPEALAELAANHRWEQPRWTFLNGPALQVRTLAAVLGVRYRAAGTGFSHDNVLIVLDHDGVPVARVEGLRQPNQPLVDAIQRIAERGAADDVR